MTMNYYNCKIEGPESQRSAKELEEELIAFQRSSKELEEALEEEVDSLDKENKKLKAELAAKDGKIKQLTAQLIDSNSEVNKLSQKLSEQKAAHEIELLHLKEELVSVEISKEDMDTNERITKHDLQLSREANNELLERLALLENDLETEKQTNAQQRLQISNLVTHLKATDREFEVIESPFSQSWISGEKTTNREKNITPATPKSCILGTITNNTNILRTRGLEGKLC